QLRRQARERREYLQRRAREQQQQRQRERRESLRRALDENRLLPTELRHEALALQKELEFDFQWEGIVCPHPLGAEPILGSKTHRSGRSLCGCGLKVGVALSDPQI
uniref:Uncharacterized protein n=1 Tax=Serinus canaria TaxID=9135 RepID=A0A8C9MMQ6_SERCA